MNDQLLTAQSAAYVLLANWVAQMDIEEHGRLEMSSEDFGELHISPAAADNFGFEPAKTTPRLHVPLETEEFFNFAPWQYAQLRDRKYLDLFAGPIADEKPSMKIVFPISYEAAMTMESARFLVLTGVVDDNNERYERPVMMLRASNDD